MWVLSFSKFKQLKFSKNVLVIYTVEMASLLARKVNMLRVVGEYSATCFSRESEETQKSVILLWQDCYI